MALRFALFFMRCALLLAVIGHGVTAYAQTWGGIEHHIKAWVTNTSKCNKISKGLQNRHIALWASHGCYYDQEKKHWKWQRPNLFATTEDLFTQTIVVPYLIPMLENAGANVFTPRERDWQTNEIIIDNDQPNKGTSYIEVNVNHTWKDAPKSGFAQRKKVYNDGENPFKDGTARMITSTKGHHASFVSYQPNIPQAGKYAVYVSYQTTEKSVDDAEYIVYHKGQETVFHVNQQIGGGTWVYLGTFDFDAGNNQFNRVVINNRSRKRGQVVTTDAIRFGGGMGNIQRGGEVSGLPRALEGARYYAQWAGMPYSVYGAKGGKNDYADDINVRSKMTNWLAGSSAYVPTLPGLGVPIELSLAIHSDAGYARDGKSLIGSLAICTTNFNNGKLNAGISRLASKNLADNLLNNAVNDLSTTQQAWVKRAVWDRNYSETRLPEVPSAILETMSHQNFPDMKLGQDPNFKFALARSIYKTILKFISTQHGNKYVVQPLTPQKFNIQFIAKNKIKLAWNAQIDPQEPSACAKSYNIYTSTGTSGFDNGKNVKGTSYILKIEPNVLYHFKITACNKGGESFPTEVLSAYYAPTAKHTVLVVNGFNRLAAPKVIDNEFAQGFDLKQDMGVSYGKTAGWVGYQTVFDKTYMGLLNEQGLGYSNNELAGKIIMGNTFDYVRDHATAIASSKKYNIVSTSCDAVLAGKVKLNKYPCIDLILGLEKYEPCALKYYKTFTTDMQQLLANYAKNGGALLVSGAYIGSDMPSKTEKYFLKKVLKVAYQPTKVAYQPTLDSITTNRVHGLGLQMMFYHMPNEEHYAVQNPEILMPTSRAMCVMQYANGTSAAVAYRDKQYRCLTMAFPFECIINQHTKKQVMSGILKYLLE